MRDRLQRGNSNYQLVRLNLADDRTGGDVDTVTTSPHFDFTGAITAVRPRQLVLNAQFEHLGAGGGAPTPPFAIASIVRP